MLQHLEVTSLTADIWSFARSALLYAQRKAESLEGTANCQVKIFTSQTFKLTFGGWVFFSFSFSFSHENNFSFLVLCFGVKIVLQDRQLWRCNIALLLSAVAVYAPACSVTFVTYSENQQPVLQTPNLSHLLTKCTLPLDLEMTPDGRNSSYWTYFIL